MPITNAGAQFITFGIGSNLSNNFIQYCSIGSGSGTFIETEETLLNETDKNIQTGSPNFETVRKVGFQFDFNSVEMSGLHFTEFGFTPSGPSLLGSQWQIERLGSIVFDGTSELQITDIIEVIRG